MLLDTAAARLAVGRLAGQMQLSVPQAAQGIIDLANEHMAQALRVISVQRGIDPAAYTLTAFGGAGGLHVCALADSLGMKHALIPIHAGVLSALGMLAAPRGRQLSHTLCGLIKDQHEAQLRERFQVLVMRGRSELLEEGIEIDAITTEFSLDLRYFGQSYTLNIPFHDLKQAAADFNRLHQQRFGHKLDSDVELVNLRVALSASGSDLSLQACDHKAVSRDPIEQAVLAGFERPVAVWRRDDLDYEAVYPGPLLIIDTVATSYVAADWTVSLHRSGCLFLDRN
jgi:N-methylhydantoinase A